VAELFLVQKKNILYLVDDKEDALYANTEMEDLLGKDKVLYFPATHLEPYQVEKTQNANLVLRTEVLNKINSGRSPKVIVAYAGALSEKVLKKEDFKAISHHIKVGDQLDFDFVDELLNHYHFQQADFVSEPGEFSVRGGIVDVFSYSYENLTGSLSLE
jgi:transcription-repair coupling factor (superfamily II helicase)